MFIYNNLYIVTLATIHLIGVMLIVYLYSMIGTVILYTYAKNVVTGYYK